MGTPRAAEHRDLEQRFRNLESQVRKLLTVVGQRPQFEVTDGDLTIRGGALVVDGGDFLLLDTDSSTVFRLGDQEYGDRGVSIYREDGSPAVEVAKADAGLPPTVRIKDANGNVIVSEWPFGEGLSAPLLSMPAYPVTAPAGYGEHGPEVSTTATAWTTLWSMRTVQQNPLWRPRLQLKCSDATTTAQVRVTKSDGTTVLNDFFAGPSWTGSVPTGSTGWLSLVPYLGIDGGFGADVTRHVQVRRTAGTGTVRLAIPCATG